MSEKIKISPPRRKMPLHGVIIFVSQQLVSSRTALHQQCITLGGKFVWVFDVPFTHYICQGKLSKKSKEYKKAEEYRAACVHPAWLKACQAFGQRVAEKLYATTYNPNRSLSFISNGDEDEDDDEENHIPSLTTRMPSVPEKMIQPLSTLTQIDQKQQNKKYSSSSLSQPKNMTAAPLQKTPSQPSTEAETMLNDLESSIEKFLRHNSNSTTVNPMRSSTIDDDIVKRSLPMIRSMNSLADKNDHDSVEPSMRVEWLDDAMQAERKKIVDEDESNFNNSQSTIRNHQLNSGKKRPFSDTNSEISSDSKKSRV